MDLEAALLRAPIESMRLNLKAMQSTVEKDLAVLADASASGTIDPAQLLKELSRLQERAAELAKAQKEQAENLEARQAYFSGFEMCYANRWANEAGYRDAVGRSLDVAITDHCAAQGFVETAREYSKARKISPHLVDFQILSEASHIVRELKAHRTAAALQWCQANRTHLRKRDSSLEPELRAQEAMQLIQSGRLHDAVAYTRKYMTKFALHYDKELGQIYSLLGGRIADKEIEESWMTFCKHFLREFMEVHGRSSHYSLLTRVSAGLAALRTKSCGDETQHPKNPLQADRASLCPACSTELKDLAELVPYAYHMQSILPADPVMLPNGHVFSQEELEEFAQQQHCWPDVMDPVSGHLFGVDVLEKVFPC